MYNILNILEENNINQDSNEYNILCLFSTFLFEDKIRKEELLQYLIRLDYKIIFSFFDFTKIFAEKDILDEVFYWNFIKVAYIYGDSRRQKQAREYFNTKKNQESSFDFLKLIDFSRPILSNKYKIKEINLIPDDFNFRYTHYDYDLMTKYENELGQNILHLGCNSGLNSIILARNGKNVYGVDIQEEAINKAIYYRSLEPPEVSKRVVFQMADFCNMQLPECFFNSMIAFDVFEHIYLDDIEIIIKKIKKSLKADGFFIIHVPYEKSFFDKANVTFYNEINIKEIFGKYFKTIEITITEEENFPGNRRVSYIGQNNQTDENTKQIISYGSNRSIDSEFFNNYYTKTVANNKLNDLFNAIDKKEPYNLVRLGDAEVYFMAYGRIEINDSKLIEHRELLLNNLGVDVFNLTDLEIRKLQNELLESCISANILGTHRHTVNEKNHFLTQKVFSEYGINSDYLSNEVDVVFNSEILDQGYLFDLLKDKKILMIGNSAVKFSELVNTEDFLTEFNKIILSAKNFNLAKPVYTPHYKDMAYKQSNQIWEEIRKEKFDVALISASLMGKIYSHKIKNQLGKVALDIGWSMQYLANYSSPVAPAREHSYASLRRGFKNLFQGRTK